MIPTLNSEKIIANCQGVARYADNEGSLRAKVGEGLKFLEETPLEIAPNFPALTFGRKEWIEFLVTRGVIPIDQAEQARAISRSQIRKFRSKIAAMREYLAAKSTSALALIDLIIAEIAVFQVARPEAGSHSAAIGLIWLNPSDNWSVEYLAELVFHELLHNILFLEDMTRGLMQDVELLEREDTRAYSAVRKTMRYFDSSFHAAFVAAGMSWYHHRLAVAGDTTQTEKMDDLLLHGRIAVADLQKVATRQEAAGRPILTSNGSELLAGMASFYEAPDFEAIDTFLAM